MRCAAPGARVRPTSHAWPATNRAGFSISPARGSARRRRVRTRQVPYVPSPLRDRLSHQIYGMMTMKALIARISQQDDVNFLLTNRIPRALATRFMGWFSRIEQPLVRDLSIGLWRLFSDPDLSEAEKTRFGSLHEAFIRALRPGVRPVRCRRRRSRRHHRARTPPDQGRAVHTAGPVR